MTVCVIPGNIHTPPQRVIGNSEGEGVLKAKIFIRESMDLNWNFQRGGGLKPKTLCRGSMDIFWNTQ